MASGSKVASGNIPYAVFVKLTTTADGKVTVCSAGDRIYGVSQPGQRYPPWGAIQDGFAAIAGENVNVFVMPEKGVMLRLNGTVLPGDMLKADTGGLGIATTGANDEIGAQAEVAGVAGQIIPVTLIGPERY